MDVLVLGAGALGQPFGFHLQRAGANLGFVVKPKYREELESGLRLHEHGLFGGPTQHEFDDFDLYTDYANLEGGDWDQVWLCVSATAIRGDWLEDFLEAIGSTTLVSIQPGLEARDYLEERYPADQIVSCRVSMIAYPTPLPGEDLPEGDVAYFMPPAQPLAFGGAMEPADDVASFLRQGGLATEVREDVVSFGVFTSAVLETFIAGLELEDWSLSRYRASETFELAMEAANQGLDVVGAEFGEEAPSSVRTVASTWVLGMGVPFARWTVPFPLEAYLEEHFTKVGDQTRAELRDLIAKGREHGLDVDAIERLAERAESA